MEKYVLTRHRISEKRNLIADVTLLWSQLSNPDQQLVQLWRRLISKFRDGEGLSVLSTLHLMRSLELNLRWDQALKLRTFYEKALGDTVSLK